MLRERPRGPEPEPALPVLPLARAARERGQEPELGKPQALAQVGRLGLALAV